MRAREHGGFGRRHGGQVRAGSRWDVSARQPDRCEACGAVWKSRCRQV